MSPPIVKQLEATLLRFYCQMIQMFKPSFAKILSTPAIVLLLLWLTLVLLFNGVDISTVAIAILVGLLAGSLLGSYILSCIIWTAGRQHRKILIIIFTVLSIPGFFIWSTILLAYICPLGTCTSISMNYLPLVLPLVIFTTGVIFFIKEEKKSGIKSRKQT